MFGLLKKVFGTAQTRLLKKYAKIVHEVNRVETTLLDLSDEQIRNKTLEFRERLKQGESIDKILPEAFAVVKNTCRRLCGTQIHVSGYDQSWDMVPYDVQILGAIAMHYGAIAEMQTGEGKTLTASMPLYLNALTGKPVHLVTVNDYLAKRDCEWIGSIFRWLGLPCLCSHKHDSSPSAQRSLRLRYRLWNMLQNSALTTCATTRWRKAKKSKCQRGHYFAIIDEVDSILIDEARTPLIISGPVCGLAAKCMMSSKMTSPISSATSATFATAWRPKRAKPWKNSIVL